MRFNKHLSIVLFVTVPLLTWSQNNTIPSSIRASMTMRDLSTLNTESTVNLLYGLPIPQGKELGDSYLSTSWNQGTILLYEKDKLIAGYLLKYDLRKDELEINTKNGVKILPGGRIKSFSWKDSLSDQSLFFISAKNYLSNTGIALSGFFEVISEGEIPLFKRIIIVVKKANYIEELDMGSRDDEILKKEEFYYVKEGKVYPLPSSKKKLLTLFNDQVEKMKSYIETNNMNLKEAHHLQSIFEYYNSLVKA